MKIKQFYLNLSEKKFKYLTISLCGGFDLLIASYVYTRLTDSERIRVTIDIAKKIVEQTSPQLNGAQIDEKMISELWQLMVMSITMAIGLFLLIHFIVYAMHLMNVKMAEGYIKFYAWTSGILTILCSLFSLNSLFGLFIIPGVLLVSLVKGFGYRKEMALRLKKQEE